MSETSLCARVNLSHGTLTVWENGADPKILAEGIRGLAAAVPALQEAGYTITGTWRPSGVDSQTLSFIIEVDVEEMASVEHVWASDVDLAELRYKVDHHIALSGTEAQQVVTLIQHVEIARNTWDSFPIRYPDFTRDKRNNFLVGVLAGVIGRVRK